MNHGTGRKDRRLKYIPRALETIKYDVVQDDDSFMNSVTDDRLAVGDIVFRTTTTSYFAVVHVSDTNSVSNSVDTTYYGRIRQSFLYLWFHSSILCAHASHRTIRWRQKGDSNKPQRLSVTPSNIPQLPYTALHHIPAIQIRRKQITTTCSLLNKSRTFSVDNNNCWVL